MQGIRWIMNREEANDLTVIQQSQKGYIDKVRCHCSNAYCMQLCMYADLLAK